MISFCRPVIVAIVAAIYPTIANALSASECAAIGGEEITGEEARRTVGGHPNDKRGLEYVLDLMKDVPNSKICRYSVSAIEDGGTINGINVRTEDMVGLAGKYYYLDVIGDEDDASHSSLSQCEALRKSQGIIDFAKCLADQFAGNFRPGFGPGPGMMMDEIGATINRELCDSVCTDRPAGDHVGDCQCQ